MYIEIEDEVGVETTTYVTVSEEFEMDDIYSMMDEDEREEMQRQLGVGYITDDFIDSYEKELLDNLEAALPKMLANRYTLEQFVDFFDECKCEYDIDDDNDPITLPRFVYDSTTLDPKSQSDINTFLGQISLQMLVPKVARLVVTNNATSLLRTCLLDSLTRETYINHMNLDINSRLPPVSVMAFLNEMNKDDVAALPVTLINRLRELFGFEELPLPMEIPVPHAEPATTPNSHGVLKALIESLDASNMPVIGEIKLLAQAL